MSVLPRSNCHRSMTDHSDFSHQRSASAGCDIMAAQPDGVGFNGVGGTPKLLLKKSVRNLSLSVDDAEKQEHKDQKAYFKQRYNKYQLPSKEKIDQLKRTWELAGQGHVFKHINKIAEDDNNYKIFYYELEQITADVLKLNEIKEMALQLEKELKNPSNAKVTPLDCTNLAQAKPEDTERSIGYDLIASGKVAALVLAGGQGSRLGYAFPKGTYDIGLPSHKSLFEVQAERIRKMEIIVGEMYKRAIVLPWYVMTSPATHKDTKEFFKEHNFFGLSREQVIFFQQGMLAAIDLATEQVIMESIKKVFIAPNGNGGIYRSLQEAGVLADMEKRGIDFICQYSVDNILTKVIDPVFVGFVCEKKTPIGCKSVKKVNPDERVGIIARKNGRPTVLEYSEIDKELQKQREKDNGDLVLKTSHTCINIYTIDFLKKCASGEYKTKFHIARKKIPTIDAQGAKIQPQKENGMKFEQFIFDTWEYAEDVAVLEVPREEQFAALKEAQGNDCPETSRMAVSNLHKKWVIAAGAHIVEAPIPALSLLEISPIVSFEGEGLGFLQGKTIHLPCEINEKWISNHC